MSLDNNQETKNLDESQETENLEEIQEEAKSLSENELEAEEKFNFEIVDLEKKPSELNESENEEEAEKERLKNEKAERNRKFAERRIKSKQYKKAQEQELLLRTINSGDLPENLKVDEIERPDLDKLLEREEDPSLAGAKFQNEVLLYQDKIKENQIIEAQRRNKYKKYYEEELSLHKAYEKAASNFDAENLSEMEEKFNQITGTADTGNGVIAVRRLLKDDPERAVAMIAYLHNKPLEVNEMISAIDQGNYYPFYKKANSLKITKPRKKSLDVDQSLKSGATAEKDSSSKKLNFIHENFGTSEARAALKELNFERKKAGLKPISNREAAEGVID